MLKLDSETVGAVCVICIDPSEKANCNYTFKDIDNLSVVPCLVVCDDTCEHYMRHEIIHSIFGYIKNIGNINLPDTQDPDLVGAGLSYNIMSPEAMEIERKNLQTCMPYLSLLNKKPVKFHLMVALYQMIITLLTTLLGLLKKKNKITELTKEDVVQILAKGHSHFEG